MLRFGFEIEAYSGICGTTSANLDKWQLEVDGGTREAELVS